MAKKVKIKKALVTANMSIGDVISKYPESAEIMLKWGLHCIGCHVAAWESIEQGAAAHGLNKAQIAKMVAEINAAIVKRKH
ncbi:MAG: DUF1858 domain-containing protein [Candidatus Aenigmatarchaeota archaeon]